MFTKTCPLEREVSKLEEGTLSPERVDSVRKHLATCVYCAEAAATRQSLSSLLHENDPAAYRAGSAGADRLRTASLRATLLERCHIENQTFLATKNRRSDWRWAIWLGGGAAIAGLLLASGIIFRQHENTAVTIPHKQQSPIARHAIKPPKRPLQQSLPVVVKRQPIIHKKSLLIGIAPEHSLALTHSSHQMRRKPKAIPTAPKLSVPAPTQVAKVVIPSRQLPRPEPTPRELPEPEHLVLITDGSPNGISPIVTRKAVSAVTVVAMGRKSGTEGNGKVAHQ